MVVRALCTARRRGRAAGPADFYRRVHSHRLDSFFASEATLQSYYAQPHPAPCPERKRRLQTRASSASARIRGCARRRRRFREESACHAACGVAHHSTRAPRRLSAQLVGSNVFVPSTEKRLYSVASCVLTWSMNLARHGRHHRAMGSSPRGHRSNTSPSARCDDTYCSPARAL